MWTAKNRARYNRDHLRYPSDLTDAEWNEIAPLIAPARSGGRRREVDVRNLVNGVMYVLSTGCQWQYIPKDFDPGARSIAISGIGAGMGPWIASMMRSTPNAGKNSAPGPVPVLASSIAGASRALKKGGAHRSARLRCGQADQREKSSASRPASPPNSIIPQTCESILVWGIAPRCRIDKCNLSPLSAESYLPHVGRARVSSTKEPSRPSFNWS